EHGILLIADEIQSGFARTGKFFACEYADIEPDLMTVAKGIAGGFPIAAVIGKAKIMDAPLPGGLGGTYGGSPVGCAAALAVIEVIKEEGLVERANQIGALFGERLNAMQATYPSVMGEIRTGRGAMIALELIHNGDNARPNTELPKQLVAKAHENGLVLLSCGFRGNVIRFLPALTISDELINEGLDILEHCLKELA
ncbi:MAG: aminotransferase class III-fold pyridoxal phosphate-dependent enzyme, partial [Motiliproteus sp.]